MKPCTYATSGRYSFSTVLAHGLVIDKREAVSYQVENQQTKPSDFIKTDETILTTSYLNVS